VSDVMLAGMSDVQITQSLAHYEAIIERGLKTFVEVGNALLAIREGKLYRYREGYDTFEDYCRDRWGFSAERARLLMRGAETVRNLSETPTIVGVLPINEGQVRPLAQLEPEQQRTVWQQAVETAPRWGNGKPKVTGVHVQRVVNQIFETEQKVMCHAREEFGNGIVKCLRCDNLYDGSEIEYCPYCAYTRDERVAYLREKKSAHVANNSGNNEWYTPPEYIEAARYVMGDIDLDPASSSVANGIVGAATFYTQDDDGLAHDWRGRVWMNPPYASHLIGKFTDKLMKHVKQGDVSEACVLVNNATDTGWFDKLFDVAMCACFVRGRIKFIDVEGNSSGAPLQGQVVLYVGPNVERFGRKFSDFGTVLYARKDSEQATRKTT